MFVGRVTSRLARTVVAQCRSSSLILDRQNGQSFRIVTNQFQSLPDFDNKVVTGQVSLLHNSYLNSSTFQRFGFCSSATPELNEKETAQSGNEPGSAVENNAAGPDQKENSGSNSEPQPNGNEPGSAVENKVAGPDQTENSGSNSEPQPNVSQSVKRRRRSTKRTAFSDSDSESDLSMDDLVRLVAEKEELLNVKHKEIEKMQDKVLRAYAEMENVMERTKREAENSNKFGIQNFAKSLLDVADNLGRASSVVKDSFAKIDTSMDTAGAVPLLKTLLEGVEMTEKQLSEVFKKFGVEKFDAMNEQFDPHRHNAVFQVPDPSTSPDTVAVVLKPGYILHERVIRPAEVGVTVAADKDAGGQESIIWRPRIHNMK